MRVSWSRVILYPLLAASIVFTMGGGSCDVKIPQDKRKSDCHNACVITCGAGSKNIASCESQCLSSGEVNCQGSSSSSSGGKVLP